ncbi:unnamed protein product [Mytilus coruscus]|uniref:Uncharacterized protein n=1 Tax=Mytilus coruscus TaxID=42192 RepID=A0A6J8CCB6_MYTCO|nr:unnamed protein product [Mytilus coruscus]
MQQSQSLVYSITILTAEIWQSNRSNGTSTSRDSRADSKSPRCGHQYQRGDITYRRDNCKARKNSNELFHCHQCGRARHGLSEGTKTGSQATRCSRKCFRFGYQDVEAGMSATAVARDQNQSSPDSKKTFSNTSGGEEVGDCYHRSQPPCTITISSGGVQGYFVVLGNQCYRH